MENKLKQLLAEKERRKKYNKINSIFPDEGEYRRELYPKHVGFLNASSKFRQLCFEAGNRTGKTYTAAYGVAVLTTGKYPHWWEGKKFDGPIECWVASVSNNDTRDICQKELLGPLDDIGSGMIPKDCIIKVNKKQGVNEAVESVIIKHASGGKSKIWFKSYEQGRKSFQGTKKQLIWLDEEPQDFGIYTECLTRLSDKENPGIMLLTFTPLFGMSEIAASFLIDGKFPKNGIGPVSDYKFTVNVTWDDVPHMDDSQKKEMLESYSEFERDARSKGLPSLGILNILPIDEDRAVIDSFRIPDHFKQVFGINITEDKIAIVWLAIDPITKLTYIVDEYFEKKFTIQQIADVIKEKGEYIPGIISGDKEGLEMSKRLFEHDIQLELYSGDVETALTQMRDMVKRDEIFIFNNIQNVLQQIRMYRRDFKMNIVKKNTELMDALRFALVNGNYYAISKIEAYTDENVRERRYGANPITGY